jgi:hypothetical protein
MEQFLNLLWLAIALLSSSLWAWFRLRPEKDPRPGIRSEAIALCCALALLFPSVSLTDDLHPQIVAVDASSGKRHSGNLIVHASQIGTHGIRAARHASSLAVLPIRHAEKNLCLVGTSESLSHASSLERVVIRLGRAPPALPLSYSI